MKRVTLRGSDIAVSRLSFGTASLHHLPSSRRRQKLLFAAFDSGFTHFDTAPSYGFGVAEVEIGRFLAESQRRRSVTIATKIGLYPPLGARPRPLSVWTRKAAGKLFPQYSQSVVDWTKDGLARGLEASLRRLRTDVVDLLLLHEPIERAIESDEVLEWLRAQRDRGTIRAWGLAGPADGMHPWLERGHPLASILQVRDSLERCDADVVKRHGVSAQLTYGYLSHNNGRPHTSDVIKGALARNATGSVVVSSRQASRIHELAFLAERFDDHDR